MVHNNPFEMISTNKRLQMEERILDYQVISFQARKVTKLRHDKTPLMTACIRRTSQRDALQPLAKLSCQETIMSLDYDSFTLLMEPENRNVIRLQHHLHSLETLYSTRIFSGTFDVDHKTSQTRLQNDIGIRQTEDSLETVLTRL